jgi:hypothetical protein
MATKSKQSLAQKSSTVVYDLSATFTAFKSWTAWERSPRFKYSATNAMGLPFLLIIPRIAVYIAMLAWFITFSAMLLKLGKFCLAYGRRKISLATRAH